MKDYPITGNCAVSPTLDIRKRFYHLHRLYRLYRFYRFDVLPPALQKYTPPLIRKSFLPPPILFLKRSTNPSRIAADRLDKSVPLAS